MSWDLNLVGHQFLMCPVIWWSSPATREPISNGEAQGISNKKRRGENRTLGRLA